MATAIFPNCHNSYSFPLTLRRHSPLSFNVWTASTKRPTTWPWVERRYRPRCRVTRPRSLCRSQPKALRRAGRSFSIFDKLILPNAVICLRDGTPDFQEPSVLGGMRPRRFRRWRDRKLSRHSKYRATVKDDLASVLPDGVCETFGGSLFPVSRRRRAVSGG
jgi:hypothetical protein